MVAVLAMDKSVMAIQIHSYMGSCVLVGDIKRLIYILILGY
jgi:hypothetical protein